jgi:peptidoglycan hydrolase CwlO-like protein
MIESKITHLMDKCHQLEAANTELQDKNDSLLKQLETKNAAEKQNEEIKALVVSKIDGLMGRLNEFTDE